MFMCRSAMSFTIIRMINRTNVLPAHTRPTNDERAAKSSSSRCASQTLPVAANAQTCLRTRKMDLGSVSMTG